MKAKRCLPLLAAAAVAAMSGANVAVAADLGAPPPPPVKAPVYVPPPFSWTGFYLGGNIGGAWAQHSVTDSYYGLAFDTGTSNGVFIGGGQVGFNYQAGWFVGGIEGDFDWAANNNNNSVGVILPVAPGDAIAVTSHNRWISTLAARLGVAANNWLFYGKVGGGWVGNNGFNVVDLTTGNSISIGSNTRTGWLAGAGIEWAVTNNWTVKVEYDYLGLGSASFIVPAGTLLPSVLTGDTFSGHRNVQEFKIGFNYLFNWGAPLAPPY
jgi:outer membrane immunogenic protein